MQEYLLKRKMALIQSMSINKLRRLYEGTSRIRQDWMPIALQKTSADMTQNYHFDWDELDQLAQAMRLPQFVVTEWRDRCHRIEALCILISRLRGHRLYKLAQEFGRDETCVSRIADAVADFLHRTWGHLLEWNAFMARTIPRLPAYAASMIEQGAPAALNIFAFIDGTFRILFLKNAFRNSEQANCKAFCGRPDGISSTVCLLWTQGLVYVAI